MAELGRLAAQELAPRRGIEIEVLDRDRGALGAGRGLDLGDARAFRVDHARALRLRAARGNRKARHRGDRGERLAAKPHGRHRLEILEAGDLAGRVAREREAQLGGADAFAVVLDLDALRAACVERDGDRARAGVEAVLEQLLQHRCRPLDYLAGGDLADEQLGQDANGAHAPSI